MEKPWTKCMPRRSRPLQAIMVGLFFVGNVSFRKCLKRMNHWIWFKKFTHMSPLTKEPAAPTHCLPHKKKLHWQDEDMCSFTFHPKTTNIPWEETTAENVCQFDLPTSFNLDLVKIRTTSAYVCCFVFRPHCHPLLNRIILSKFQLWLLSTYCKISNKKSPHRAPSLIKDSPWWMG